jgi:hypothetical protein
MKFRPLLLVLILCLFVALTSCEGRAGPGKTVSNFVHHVEQGHADAAIELLSSKIVDALGKPKLEVSLSAETERVKEKGGIKSVVIEKEDINGETATVKSMITFGNGETRNDESKLVKENGKWKVDTNK